MNIQGKEYTFVFQHGPKGNPRTTVCFVEIDGLYVGGGLSQCSERDHFEEEIGRRVSLGRALRAIIPEKPIRSAIWTQYLTENSSLFAGKPHLDADYERAISSLARDDNGILSWEVLQAEAYRNSREAALQLLGDFRGEEKHYAKKD